MGVFTSERVVQGNPNHIRQVAEYICAEFRNDGFETEMDSIDGGGMDISLSKGGIFKSLVGLKSALKVTLTPQYGAVHVKAGVGIFGQQALPSVVTYMVGWPLLLAQIWGMVQQSQLDDKAIMLAEQEFNRLSYVGRSASSSSAVNAEYAPDNYQGGKFCPNCGEKIVGRGAFCSNCGEKL